MTPVFPTVTDWMSSGPNSFWGPSVHWNTELQQYVMLLNHTCCGIEWPQEGIYITLTADLDRPEEWRRPTRIMTKSQIGGHPAFYPQVLGLGPGESGHEAGPVARLYVHGRSEWELLFHRNSPPPPPSRLCRFRTTAHSPGYHARSLPTQR